MIFFQKNCGMSINNNARKIFKKVSATFGLHSVQYNLSRSIFKYGVCRFLLKNMFSVSLRIWFQARQVNFLFVIFDYFIIIHLNTCSLTPADSSMDTPLDSKSGYAKVFKIIHSNFVNIEHQSYIFGRLHFTCNCIHISGHLQ